MKLLENTNKIIANRKREGWFDIYILDDNITIYKKNKKRGLGPYLKKKIKKDKAYLSYKEKIEESYKTENNHTIRGYDVERDGSYKCMYIEGYRLDRISDNINSDILIKIKEATIILRKSLNDNNNLSGDWALHNLIYSVVDNKIYNIDIEGFFSYKYPLSNDRLELINSWIDKLIEDLNKLL